MSPYALFFFVGHCRASRASQLLLNLSDYMSLFFLLPSPSDEYPSSSHYTHKWDKMVVDISEEEKNEKLEGDAALNKLFQQIYCDGSDEVKRAMNKSFVSVLPPTRILTAKRRRSPRLTATQDRHRAHSLRINLTACR